MSGEVPTAQSLNLTVCPMPNSLCPSLGSGCENLVPILDFLTEGPGGWVPTSSTLLGRSPTLPRGQDCDSEAQVEQMQITACQAPTVRLENKQFSERHQSLCQEQDHFCQWTQATLVLKATNQATHTPCLCFPFFPPRPLPPSSQLCSTLHEPAAQQVLQAPLPRGLREHLLFLLYRED